ncbi:hypothetical protein niasHT_003924 [Heterodera trifolii]|uniref:Uncharacterized protein n=1 Tax=Heterodera trifolii TaxID=157864 RepID=A0ABD2LVI2_9BILA
MGSAVSHEIAPRNEMRRAESEKGERMRRGEGKSGASNRNKHWGERRREETAAVAQSGKSSRGKEQMGEGGRMVATKKLCERNEWGKPKGHSICGRKENDKAFSGPFNRLKRHHIIRKGSMTRQIQSDLRRMARSFVSKVSEILKSEAVDKTQPLSQPEQKTFYTLAFVGSASHSLSEK